MKFEGKKSPRDFQRDNQWRQKKHGFWRCFFWGLLKLWFKLIKSPQISLSELTLLPHLLPHSSRSLVTYWFICILFIEAAHNPLVPGSSPGGPTTYKAILWVAFLIRFSCRYMYLKAVFSNETVLLLFNWYRTKLDTFNNDCLHWFVCPDRWCG